MYILDKKERKEIIWILKNAGAKSDLKGVPYLDIWKKMTFNEKLNAYIKRFTRSGFFKEAQIYKRCKMDKRTFSKIKNNKKPNYHPKKNTVLSLIIGLGLNMREAEDLLSTVGYSFIKDDELDNIIKKYIRAGNYDIDKIDDELFKKTGRTLCFYEK